MVMHFLDDRLCCSLMVEFPSHCECVFHLFYLFIYLFVHEKKEQLFKLSKLAHYLSEIIVPLLGHTLGYVSKIRY